MPTLEVLSIEKSYGSQKALDKVGFVIDKPQIVALLGPNGAGKSTLMKIITTYKLPDSGQVRVNGYSIWDHPMQIRKQIGYLPEHNPLYLNMYVFEYLEFSAGFFGVNKSRIQEVAQITGIVPESRKKLKDLSKGYRQRVGLAAAILHDPPVLIMDEPTTGLDPSQVIDIRELIKNLSQNKIILFSTHIMQEVERMADRVIMIKKGQLVFDKKMGELKKAGQVILVEFDQRVEKEFLKRIPYLISFQNVGGNTWELNFNTTSDMRPQVFDFAVQNGLKIMKIDYMSRDLEDFFKS